MRNNRLEVFDTDDNMELFFNGELAKFQRIYSNCCVQRLL